MGESRLRRAVERVFKELVAGEHVSPDEAEVLHDATLETAGKRIENRTLTDSDNEAFLKGEFQFDDWVEERRKHGTLGTPVSVTADRSVVRQLVEASMLTETRLGLSIEEPFWHLPFRVMYGTAGKTTPATRLSLLQRCVCYVVSRFAVFEPLEQRLGLANQVAYFTGSEPGILFSNTPAVFDPFELEESRKNYTHAFLESLCTTPHPMIYVWNEQAVARQVAKNIASWRSSLEDLKQLYHDHFLPFALKANLEIYWGDNSQYTTSRASLPYISESSYILGFREDDKLRAGVLVDRKQIRRIISRIPAANLAQDVVPRVFEPVLGPKTFGDLRRVLVDTQSYSALGQPTPVRVVHFIDEWFTRAAGLFPRRVN